MEVLEKLKTLREERGWKVGLSLSGVGQTKTLEKALKTGLPAGSLVHGEWRIFPGS